MKISVLPVGRRCFGLFKWHYRKMKISCLDDNVAAVNRSAAPSFVQLVGSQDGATIVTMCNWSDYFDDKTAKTAVKGITQMQCFRFLSTHPGKVMVKYTHDVSCFYYPQLHCTHTACACTLPSVYAQ